MEETKTTPPAVEPSPVELVEELPPEARLTIADAMATGNTALVAKVREYRATHPADAA